ncbi:MULTISPECIES: hypothetical protein [Sphingobacterium]|uniref:hypothetical protein n=1 Tax=Sphingobacterium TaxID=28453 RepID=UPI0038FC4BB7
MIEILRIALANSHSNHVHNYAVHPDAGRILKLYKLWLKYYRFHWRTGPKSSI